MALLNSHQILGGARTYAGEKTYTLCYLRANPTFTTSGSSITITGGILEVEGRDYTFNNTLNFSNFAGLVSEGSSYIIGAVASYNEPTSRSAAEAAGLDYFVSTGSTGETIASRFIDSTIEQGALNKGGYAAIERRVQMGSATPSDYTIYYAYQEAEERLTDPRYSTPIIYPKGFELMLSEVVLTDNAPKPNALYDMSLDNFKYLVSQLGLLHATRRVFTTADANARFFTAKKTHLVQSARQYPTQNDAINDTNGTAVNMSTATAFGGTHVGVFESTYPSTLPIGQIGEKEAVVKHITKKDSALLGRMNPIYLDTNQFSIRFPNHAASRMTNYGYPAKLYRVTLGPSLAVTNVVSILDDR